MTPRWSDEEKARYYASGIWDRRGLYALLRERAAETPEKLAFHDGHEGITYAQLEARARDLATTIEPGSIIAVQLPNTIEARRHRLRRRRGRRRPLRAPTGLHAAAGRRRRPAHPGQPRVQPKGARPL